MNDDNDEPTHNAEAIRRSFLDALNEGAVQTERDGVIVYYWWTMKVKPENRRAHLVMTVDDHA